MLYSVSTFLNQDLKMDRQQDCIIYSSCLKAHAILKRKIFICTNCKIRKKYRTIIHVSLLNPDVNYEYYNLTIPHERGGGKQ